MTDLERELRLLGDAVAWPGTPDLATAVRDALARTPIRRPPWWRRRPLVAVALATLVAAFAAAMAVPQARTAILRALGIGSVRVELVDELPRVSPRSDLSLLGLPVSLAEARAGFPHPLLVPDTDALGPYDEVRLGFAPLVQVSYVWRGAQGDVRLLVSVLPGRFVGAQFVKVAGPGTTLDERTVDGRRALWIAGSAHGFGLVGTDGASDFEELRLAGNTLLIDRGETTIRIEGDLTRQQALEVSRSLVEPP